MSRGSDIDRQPLATTPALPSAATPPGREDLQARIRVRAHELYQDRLRNGGSGDALSDWLRAEREVRAACPPSTPSPRERDENSLVVVETRHRARGETLLRQSAD